MKHINIFLFLFFISFSQSQVKDFDKVFSNINKTESISDAKKLSLNNSNPFLAFALSAIIPGAGQFYNKNYKRGLAYLTFELFNWSNRLKYLDKGDSFVKQYKSFAQEHWSFDKWIRDINLFANPQNPVFQTMDDANGEYFYPWFDSHHIEFHLNGFIRYTNGSNGDNWFENNYKVECSEAIENFEQCNTDLFMNAEINKDHNFYEGIGKYNLFFAGWDDTHQCEQLGSDENCSYIFLNNNTENALTNNKGYYQFELRDNANKNYDIAENALSFIFINHAVSMLDAFIVNLSNNKSSFNYITQPLYDNDIKFKGLKISILW